MEPIEFCIQQRSPSCRRVSDIDTDKDAAAGRKVNDKEKFEELHASVDRLNQPGQQNECRDLDY